MTAPGEARVGYGPGEIGRRLVGDGLPAWLRPVVDGVDGVGRSALVPWLGGADERPRRRSAVLILFADGLAGPDLLLTARAATLRSHAGQPAFPGGTAEPGETAVQTALREAAEETGLVPASVTPVALLPELGMRPTNFLVVPVIAWWRTPGPVAPVDPAETAAVVRVPVAQLADPAHRGQVHHPSGFIGPAFDVAGLVVWGFTAGLVDLLLRLGGWERTWSRDRRLSLPAIAPVDPQRRELTADGSP